MDTTSELIPPVKPQPTLSSCNNTTHALKTYKNARQDDNLSPTPIAHEAEDFDPFSTAKPCSPFYLYNHDSPRVSSDYIHKPSIHVSVSGLDLEKGASNMTRSSAGAPRISKETSRVITDTGHMRIWSRRRNQCMTKPKQRRCEWLQALPKWQRYIIKASIALLIIGAMVGIAVGITVSVHGGVWKGQNSTSQIGR